MKTLILAATALAFVSTITGAVNAGTTPDGICSIDQMSGGAIDRRRKPRVPGGSGCDDPGDLIEHPQCRRAFRRSVLRAGRTGPP